MCANKDWARNPESQCSLCPNVYGKNSSHSIVAKWALSTEDSFEQGKILANTRSILLLLNDADNIKCSRSNVKYVTQVKKHFITILINFLAEDTCVDLFGFIDLGNGTCNFFSKFSMSIVLKHATLGVCRHLTMLFGLFWVT